MRRVAAMAAVSIVVPLLAVAPAVAATGVGERHHGPPRVLSRDQLRSRSLSAFAAADNPYIIKDVSCGSDATQVVRAPSLTLFAYGADGGDNAVGRRGGAGSIAVGAYMLPVGTNVRPLVGCQGETARANSSATTAGGATAGGWPGGNGGSGTVNGESGGAGGGMSAWYFSGQPLIEAAGGGGAGGGAGGGPGGDGDRNGTNAPTGGATGGKKGRFGARGAGGAPGGQLGAFGNAGGWGALADGNRIGGGGGGAGVLGGGGGGGGNHATLAPGAGGGGGGSAFYTDAGYVAFFGGAGHGEQLDGLSQIVRVRPIVSGPYWPGWDIVRGVAQNGTKSGGYIVDAFGGLHTFSQGTTPPATSGGPYWPGWDIVRGIAVMPDGSGGYLLDGFGGLHSFRMGNHPRPPAITNGPYWAGRDIARGVTLLPDGSGGYVVDGQGGLHAFSIGAGPKPPAEQNGPHWLGFDIARGVSSPFVLDGRAGGWIADSLGNLHPWGYLIGAPTPEAAGAPRFARPLARGMASFFVGAGGVEVDAYGGLHPFSSPGLP